MSGGWAWAALAGLGVYHGVNPAMGWLFAVALGLAVLVGVPYPKPTAKQRALMHFYETKFRKGWEYTVKAPTYRKMAQAIGRLIRTETDIGAAVILDRRAKQFADRMDMRAVEAPVNELVRFFRSRGQAEKD